MVLLGTSVLQVSDYVASPYPFPSCTAVVPSSEDKLMTEDEGRDVLSDRPARDAASLQGPLLSPESFGATLTLVLYLFLCARLH